MSNSFCTIIEYKARMPGINIPNTIIENALETTAKLIRRKIFVQKSFKTASQSTEFEIDTPIADYNMDGDVDASDIEIFELTPEYEEIDRSDKIDVFREKYGYIKTTEQLPVDSANELIIEYYTGKYRNKEMKEMIKDLNMYYANDYLFNNIGFEKLQDGISSWSINGQSISFDVNSFNSIREENAKKLNRLLYMLTPFYSDTTNLGFNNDDRTMYRSGNLNNFKRI